MQVTAQAKEAGGVAAAAAADGARRRAPGAILGNGDTETFYAGSGRIRRRVISDCHPSEGAPTKKNPATDQLG